MRLINKTKYESRLLHLASASFTQNIFLSDVTVLRNHSIRLLILKDFVYGFKSCQENLLEQSKKESAAC